MALGFHAESRGLYGVWNGNDSGAALRITPRMRVDSLARATQFTRRGLLNWGMRLTSSPSGVTFIGALPP
eukprot:12708545-Alexandrium_andersonii.AAC.1